MTTWRRHQQFRSGEHRRWWTVLAVVCVVGVVLWLLGVEWGAALPGLSLLGFVVRVWLDTTVATELWKRSDS